MLQSRLGIGKGVALDERFELRPARGVEQRTERIAIGIDELARRWIRVRQQRGELRRRLTRPSRTRRRRGLNRR